MGEVPASEAPIFPNSLDNDKIIILITNHHCHKLSLIRADVYLRLKHSINRFNFQFQSYL